MGFGHNPQFVQDRSVVLGERSSAAVAVASWHHRVHLAWTGSDTRLNVMSSPDGHRFEGKRTFDHRSSTQVNDSSFSSSSDVGASTSTSRTVALAPALDGGAGALRLAWTGTDRRLNTWAFGRGAAGHVVLPQRSPCSPALAAWGPRVAVIAWTGTDRHLNLLYAQDGSLGEPRRFDDTSVSGPAVCANGPEIVVAWTGTDRHVNVLYSQERSFAHRLRLDARSNSAPALCTFGDAVVLGWTGTDRRLNLLVLRPGAAPVPVAVEATSNHPPSVTAHLGGLVVAWTGSDGRLNIGHLRRVG